MPPPSQGLHRLTKTLCPQQTFSLFRPSAALRPRCIQSRNSSSTPESHRRPAPIRNQHPRSITAFQHQRRNQIIRNASSTTTAELKHTPLHDLHTNLNAKFGPFAGYSMPLTYPPHSHADSHLWTRSHASIFDVSHMVQHKLSGPLAEEFLMTITPSAIDTLPKHTSTLSCLLNGEGGIVDDTVITRLGRDSFYFVTNAGCREQDLAFIQAEMDKFLSAKKDSSGDKPITWHVLSSHSLLALQGPLAAQILQPLLHNDPEDSTVNTDLSTLYFGHSRWLQLDLPGTCTKEKTSLSTPSLLVSRTGYTGEDGFEISIPPESGSSADLAISIAKALLSAKLAIDGTDQEVCRMAGLAARDSLRLEAGMCLYGHDIDQATTPPVAALGWVVAKSRRGEGASPTFNGKSIVGEQLASPKTIERRRVGLTIEAGPAAREGAEIVSVSSDGKESDVLGKITSGCPSPSLNGKNIAMGYVKSGFHKKGTEVGVKVRGKIRKGVVEKMPFVENRFYRGEGAE